LAKLAFSPIDKNPPTVVKADKPSRLVKPLSASIDRPPPIEITDDKPSRLVISLLKVPTVEIVRNFNYDNIFFKKH